MSLSLSKSSETKFPRDGLTIHSIVPPEAGLGYKIELFYLDHIIPEHSHKFQTQLTMMVEGSLNYMAKVIGPGSFISTSATTPHTLDIYEKVGFVTIYIPAEDDAIRKAKIYDEFIAQKPITELAVDTQTTLSKQDIEFLQILPNIPDIYYIHKIESEGYIVYELASKGDIWSCAILDLITAPEHYHKIENEHFIVLGGTLEISLNNAEYITLHAGQSVHIPPFVRHHLRSASKDSPCRLLCFNFPAFSADDFHVVDMIGSSDE